MTFPDNSSRVVQQIEKKYPHPIEAVDNSGLAYRASHITPAKPSLEFIKAVHKVSC
jgi:hypothetical protein